LRRNKKVYESAAYHLSLPPHKIAMVAAHRFDLIAATSIGFKTIYVPRPTEDLREVREGMRSKKDGGEVDT
jgi:FMN phosphatase YigB (HAD superfamily)